MVRTSKCMRSTVRSNWYVHQNVLDLRCDPIGTRRIQVTPHGYEIYNVIQLVCASTWTRFTVWSNWYAQNPSYSSRIRVLMWKWIPPHGPDLGSSFLVFYSEYLESHPEHLLDMCAIQIDICNFFVFHGEYLTSHFFRMPSDQVIFFGFQTLPVLVIWKQGAILRHDMTEEAPLP